MYIGDVFHPDRPTAEGRLQIYWGIVELFRALVGEASDRPPKAGGEILPG